MMELVLLDKMPSDEHIAEIAEGNGRSFERAKGTIANNHKPSQAELHMAELLQMVTTSAELLDKHFEPMQWLVQDLIPAEGLSVLGSKMGNGKSYFLLQLAAALSTGTPFLGRQTQRQGVLLIALEDSERRINSRLEQLGVIGTDKLLIATRWAKGKHALEDLRLMLQYHPEIRTVIIDPIVKFIDLIDFNEYGGAYDKLGPIKDILDGRHVAGIFSHHCKKSLAELDAFDDLLGSTGWGAACDTRLVLRRQRGSDEGTLIAGGRDVMHSESAILFEGDRGWQYQGAAEDIRMSRRATGNPRSPGGVRAALSDRNLKGTGEELQDHSRAPGEAPRVREGLQGREGLQEVPKSHRKCRNSG